MWIVKFPRFYVFENVFNYSSLLNESLVGRKLLLGSYFSLSTLNYNWTQNTNFPNHDLPNSSLPYKTHTHTHAHTQGRCCSPTGRHGILSCRFMIPICLIKVLCHLTAKKKKSVSCCLDPCFSSDPIFFLGTLDIM